MYQTNPLKSEIPAIAPKSERSVGTGCQVHHCKGNYKETMRTPASLFSSFFAATFAAMLFSTPAHAQSFGGNAFLQPTQPQRSGQNFHSQQRGGWEDFAYTYTTRKGTTQSLQFSLSADDITRGSAEFQPWNDQIARNNAILAVQQTARRMEQPNLKATVIPVADGMDIRVSGYGLSGNSPQVQQLEQTLHTTYTTTIQTFASRNLYRATQTGPHNTSIQPDHPAIAIRYTAAMGPVARAIAEQVPGATESPRAFINAALNWLQTIPYDTLLDRATSNGAGFQTPYGLIQGNRGDCDTKATALAAIMRAAYPSLPLVMIYVPDHAFLGIGLPKTDADYALNTQYGIYVLADATGPALSPLGYIDPATQSKIRANETTLLPIR